MKSSPRGSFRRHFTALTRLEDRLAPAGLLAAGSPVGAPAAVDVYAADTGELVREFSPFDPRFTGGVRVATGDVTDDGIADFITAAGPGGGPHVRVFDGHTGAPVAGPLGSLFPFDLNFTGGVSVASADVDGDGHDDVITAAGAGGGPHVRIFSGFDGQLLGEFFAYDLAFPGGVDVAAGDFTGDGRAEIVTGAGPGGGPNVRVFDGATLARTRDFLAFNAAFPGGVHVAVGQTDSGDEELIASAGPGGGPNVRVYRGPGDQLISDFFAFDATATNGVRLAPADSARSANFDDFYATSSSGGGLGTAGTLAELTGASPLLARPPQITQVMRSGAFLAGTQDTALFKSAGLGSYFQGEAANLPRTNQKPPPNNGYEVPNTPTPNVTDAFLQRGLPVQTTDWWSPVINRSTNHPGDTGWAGNSNNNPVALVADPVVYGLRPDQTGQADQLHFALGQNIAARSAHESHYQLGNVVPSESGLVNNSTRVYYRFTPLESNGKMDVQVGVFDPAVPAGPDNAGDGSNSPAQRAVPATNIAVDNYSDWGATFAWTDATNSFGMSVTGMVGNPFTYFTPTGNQNVELYFGRVIQSVRTDVPVQAKDNLLTTKVLSNDNGVLVIEVPQLDGQRFAGAKAYYAFFAPAGTKWNVAQRTTTDGSLTYDAKAEIDLGGKNYFSAAALPAAAIRTTNGVDEVVPEILELFRSHAYAFPVDLGKVAGGSVGNTRVTPAFDATTGLLTTKYEVFTKLMEAGPTVTPNINGTLLTLYPHQYDHLDVESQAALAASPAATYVSPKGELKLFVPTRGPVEGQPDVESNHFTTTLTYRGGVLPALPGGITDPADNDILLKYLARVAANPYDQLPIDPQTKASGAGNFLSQDGAYDSGKRALRIANLLPLFDMVTPTADYPAASVTAMRNTLLDQVKRHIADWFDATDYKFFLNDIVWDTMLPYPDDGFLAIQKINDHHFHFGYFLKAAALVARYDPAFVSDAQFGPLLTLLAKDVANVDRNDTRFPFLRNFQPYLGHNYADGVAGDDQGNNQESSSEAMNFSTGLILLGEAMMAVNATLGRQLRDTGVYLFTTEEQSIGEYWYDTQGRNFPDDFTDSYDATTITGNIDATQTTINVQATSTASTDLPIRLPSVTPFTIRIDRELMIVTASQPGPQLTLSNGGTINTYNWTVTRGAMGTTAEVHWPQNTFNESKNNFTTQPWVKTVSIQSAPYRATTVATAIDAASTTLTVATAERFPRTNGFLASVGNEIVRVTAGAGTTTWTIERGAEGSTAVGHGADEPVRLLSPTPITAATIIQGGALNRSNFFAGDSVDEPGTNFSINWLPVNASSLYQGRYRNADGGLYARDAFDSMINMESFLFSDEPVYAAAAYKYVVNGVLKGTAGQGGEYPGNVWAYQAFSDPAGALGALSKYVLTPETPDLLRTQGSPGGFDGLDQGESVAFTFSFAHSLAMLGEVDPTGYATTANANGSVGTYAVFRDPTSGVRKYVAYNPTTSANTLTFRGGDGAPVTITVPAGSLVMQTGADAATFQTELTPPQGLPSTTPPANRLFLRGEYHTVGGESQLKTSLSATPGTGTVAVVLPVSPNEGTARGPDFFPGPVEFDSPMSFEVSGVNGKPVADANSPGGARTAYSIPLLNNLFRNPVDETKDVQFNENSALVVLNVGYFADANDAKPSRVEVWSLGPQTYDGNGTLQPGFNTGRATWQPYISQTWFDRAPGNESVWFIGDYPEMTNGKVRVTIWTSIPNKKQDGKTDLPQSQIGLRTNAALNQQSVAYIDIPYDGVTIGL